MSFAAVGSPITWDSDPGILFTPNGVGNLIVVCELVKLGQTPMLTNIASSNVTWSRLTPDFNTTVAATPTAAAIWIGTVTSASQASITLTWSAPGTQPAHWEASVFEFSSTVGSWALDTWGGIDANGGNKAYPSLTPAAAHELYIGIDYDDTGAVAGSTPGYTYQVTSHGNGALFNPDCSTSTQAPTWAGTSVMGGIAALIKETPASVSGTGAVSIPKMTVSGSGFTEASGTGAVTAKKMSAAGSGAVTSIQRLFDFPDPPPTAILAADTAGYTLAMQFSVTQNAPLREIWFYSGAGAGALPTQVGVFDHTWTVVAENLSPSWSGAAGSGWIKVDFDGSVTLTSGVVYFVAVFYNGGADWYWDTSNYWTTGGGGATGLSNGILTAPNDVSAQIGQDAFNPGGAGLSTPTTSFNSSNYWLDVGVEITNTPSVTGTGAVTIPKMTLSGIGNAPVIGTGAVTIPKMTVSGSSTSLTFGHISLNAAATAILASSGVETDTISGNGTKTATISTTGGT